METAQRLLLMKKLMTFRPLNSRPGPSIDVKGLMELSCSELVKEDDFATDRSALGAIPSDSHLLAWKAVCLFPLALGICRIRRGNTSQRVREET